MAGMDKMHLKPMPADFLHEEETHFILMASAVLLDQVQQVLEALPPPPPQIPREPLQGLTLEQALEASVALSLALPAPQPPTTAALRAALALLPGSKTALLRQACHKADNAIRYLRHCGSGRDFDATDAFLVSPLWARRMETTLGGVLLPAYVGHWTFV